MRVISVETDPHASDEEMRAVARAFRDSGAPVEVTRQDPYVGAGGPDNWIIIAVLSGFFGAAGKAAFDRLAALIRRLAESREPITTGNPDPVGTIILRDRQGGELEVAITERTLPSEAWDELEAVTDRLRLRGCRLYWNRAAREWRSDDLYQPLPDDPPRRGRLRGMFRRFRRARGREDRQV